jgi:uncharacterized protein YjbI with pentapeptide repeats
MLKTLQRLIQPISRLFGVKQKPKVLTESSKNVCEIISNDKFWSDYRSGRRDYQNCVLEGVDLAQEALSGCNFRKTDFRMVKVSSAQINLEGAELTEANLSGITLKHVNLKFAILVHANLEGSQLGYANLHRANLSRANLSYANLARAWIEGANLAGANLNCANLGHVYGMGITRFSSF